MYSVLPLAVIASIRLNVYEHTKHIIRLGLSKSELTLHIPFWMQSTRFSHGFDQLGLPKACDYT